MIRDKEIKVAKKFLKDRQVGDFKELYDLYYQGLCYFAYGYLNDYQESEGAVQECFVKLWEGRYEINSEEKLGGYLYATVRNYCKNQLRQNKTQEAFIKNQSIQATNDWEEDDSLSFIKSEVYREILKTIEQLPARMQEVFKLSYLTQLTEDEVAERLSISVNSVKTQKQRAKKILRKELKHLMVNILIFHL